jgi:signal transduction histidine kinase
MPLQKENASTGEGKRTRSSKRTALQDMMPLYNRTTDPYQHLAHCHFLAVNLLKVLLVLFFEGLSVFVVNFRFFSFPFLFFSFFGFQASSIWCGARLQCSTELRSRTRNNPRRIQMRIWCPFQALITAVAIFVVVCSNGGLLIDDLVILCRNVRHFQHEK